MEWWKKLIIGVVAFLFVFGVGFFSGRQGVQGAGGDDTAGDVERMEVLTGQLGSELGALREECDRFEEYAGFLKTNNLEAGRVNSLLQQENSDLRINNRELTATVERLDGSLDQARSDQGKVRDGIGRIIEEAESGANETVD